MKQKRKNIYKQGKYFNYIAVLWNIYKADVNTFYIRGRYGNPYGLPILVRLDFPENPTSVDAEVEVLFSPVWISDVYPNPGSGKFNFKVTWLNGNDPEKLTLKLYDLSGNMLRDITSALKNSINNAISNQVEVEYTPEGLSAGTYLLVISDGSSQKAEKLIYLK